MSDQIGPNVKRLIIYKMSIDAIPPGGGVKAGITFLSNPTAISKSARESCEWVKTAISMARKAAEPNPYKNVSDEEIAGDILKRIEERKAKQKLTNAK